MPKHWPSLNGAVSAQQHFKVRQVVFKVGAFYRGEAQAVVKLLQVSLTAKSDIGTRPCALLYARL